MRYILIRLTSQDPRLVFSLKPPQFLLLDLGETGEGQRSLCNADLAVKEAIEHLSIQGFVRAEKLMFCHASALSIDAYVVFGDALEASSGGSNYVFLDTQPKIDQSALCIMCGLMFSGDGTFTAALNHNDVEYFTEVSVPVEFSLPKNVLAASSGQQ